MILVNLKAWTPAPPPALRYPVFRAVEHILHRAYPLTEDEPQGRLLEALTALHDADEGLPACHEPQVRPLEALTDFPADEGPPASDEPKGRLLEAIKDLEAADENPPAPARSRVVKPRRRGRASR
jgi:hypothetical protein